MSIRRMFVRRTSVIWLSLPPDRADFAFDRQAFMSPVEDASVRLELVLVVDFERRVLLGLAQHAVADDEELDLVAHEATEGILGRADDGLAAHVEARVDQHAAAGLLLEA